ncbi:hypothetical protein BJ322DRAFT_1073133 [Thelephora terrestris]|uniref:Uncharacterized protein n=1 Tax=Thelephora terrestris TaxID=56493 RepID=A0A9P6HA82_9AGAM|nr:hypothetical protein BJ322DRAFT_1073133 [Thelephora terrestris]
MTLLSSASVNPQNLESVLSGHPIFNSSTGSSCDTDLRKVDDASLELSINSLYKSKSSNAIQDGGIPSGRRRTMLIKDADLIVAVGKEVRMTSLTEFQLSASGGQTFKTLCTPNLQFEVHELVLNPNGRLLAVVGAFQVTVIVLPRPGFTRLAPQTVDCKSLQVGQFYHASGSSPQVAKVDWHPWGENGSTLLVMTSDGKLREYDISIDADEPQQTISFMPERRASRSFLAQDSTEREVVSFTLGKGAADWGPLTVYALTKSGDIYSFCPYLPKNASVPSTYIHALQLFVEAKRDQTLQEGSSSAREFSVLYEYQHKYVTALVKQLPSGTPFPTQSQSVSIHPPTTIKHKPLRQGPFLLQPSPLVIEGSEGGDATDIIYTVLGNEDDEDDETEKLGIVMIAYQDGKVDVCLDVDKVEARWEKKTNSADDLPMFAVYETVDLGIVSMLNKLDPSLLDILQGNHPVFVTDPIHGDSLYLYHAFGVQVLSFRALLEGLAVALQDENDDKDGALQEELKKEQGVEVTQILSTFSVERRSSNPVVSLAIPNDVYLSYSIFMLTSAMRVVVLPLTPQTEIPFSQKSKPTPTTPQKMIVASSKGQPSTTCPSPATETDKPKAWLSSSEFDPYTVPPIFSQPLGLPTNPRLALPASQSKSEFVLTPDTMRYLGQTVEHLRSQIDAVEYANTMAVSQVQIQTMEFHRQVRQVQQILVKLEASKTKRSADWKERVEKVRKAQDELLERLDRTLRIYMRKVAPELSEQETKWFEELKRMKAEVLGQGKYDEQSLRARTKLLQREYDRVVPSLKELDEKVKERRSKQNAANQGLGASQAFEYGQRSIEEKIRLENLEKQVLALAQKLSLDVGTPPSDTSEKQDSSAPGGLLGPSGSPS